MAKKKSGVNKSEEIRKHLDDNPDATPTQIVDALAQRGIRVTPSLASNVKYSRGLKRKRKKKAVKKKGGRRPAAGRAATTGLSADDVVLANEFANELGGISQARKALETLERLQ